MKKILFLLAITALFTVCDDKGGDDPRPPADGRYERLISQIRILDSNNDVSTSIRFDYDDDQRLTHAESVDDDRTEFVYDFSYAPGSITIAMDDGHDEATLRATLGSTGQATQITLDWGDGDQQTIGIEYRNGRLQRVADSDGYEELFRWSGENIASVSYPLDDYRIDFDYTDRPNKTNIDLGWLLGGLGGSSIEELTMFLSDRFGERCADLLAGWDDGEDSVEFDYRFDNADWPTKVTATWYYQGEVNGISTCEIIYR